MRWPKLLIRRRDVDDETGGDAARAALTAAEEKLEETKEHVLSIQHQVAEMQKLTVHVVAAIRGRAHRHH